MTITLFLASLSLPPHLSSFLTSPIHSPPTLSLTLSLTLTHTHSSTFSLFSLLHSSTYSALHCFITFKCDIIMCRTYSSRGEYKVIQGSLQLHFISNAVQVIRHHCNLPHLDTQLPQLFAQVMGVGVLNVTLENFISSNCNRKLLMNTKPILVI